MENKNSKNRIGRLIYESTLTGANIETKQALVGMTRIVSDSIYQGIVAKQPTSQPTAILFGIKYLNHNNEQGALSNAVYSGAVGDRDIHGIPDMEAKTYDVDDMFKVKDSVYKVVDSVTFASVDTDGSVILDAIIKGKIRQFGDVAPTSYFENDNAVISDAKFTIDKWKMHVGTRKLKTDMTVELLQDMEAMGLKSAEVVDECLASLISADVNKDFFQKLITVSKRYNTETMVEGLIDISDESDAVQGRLLYRYICDMNAYIQRTTLFNGTYIACTPRVAGILSSSGWAKESKTPEADYTLQNGMDVYVDTNNPFDYVLVGMKHEFGDSLDQVGSLYFAPYEESGGETGIATIIIDPSSLQPKISVMLRYALSVNPYTLAPEIDEDGNRKTQEVKGDEWDKLVGKSNMSVFAGVKLPKLKMD